MRRENTLGTNENKSFQKTYEEKSNREHSTETYNIQKGRTAQHGLPGRLEMPEAEPTGLKTSQQKWST